MQEEPLALGKQPNDVIVQRLKEIGDSEAAQFYEMQATAPSQDEGLRRPPRRWLYTNYQYGFIRRFKVGSQRFHKIIPAHNMEADNSLQNKRINIRLDWLYAFSYPPSFMERLGIGENIHSIL